MKLSQMFYEVMMEYHHVLDYRDKIITQYEDATGKQVDKSEMLKKNDQDCKPDVRELYLL